MKAPKFTKDKVWETIAVMLFGFSVIHFLVENETAKIVFIIVNVVIGAAAVLSFPLATLIVKAWWKFAELLGGVMSKVLLSIVFFVFLTPIALLYRLFTKRTNSEGWKERNVQFGKELFGKVW